MTWTEVASGVYARRYEELDLTTGLVIGADRCLVVDTRGDVEQGGELAAAVREVTELPWSVVYTHSHFDHAFGTTAFLPCDVWAQERCLGALVHHGEAGKAKWAEKYRALGKPEIADAIARTGIMAPDRLVAERAELDLGGRVVELRHPGRAHTDHDLIVHVSDARAVFAGDVVEHGPSGFTEYSFGDETHLAEWPGALDAILALEPEIVVPGHGDPVGPAFVREHRDGLRRLVELKNGGAGESPYPAEVTRAALATP